jgi:hypothetical protein
MHEMPKPVSSASPCAACSPAVPGATSFSTDLTVGLATLYRMRPRANGGRTREIGAERLPIGVLIPVLIYGFLYKNEQNQYVINTECHVNRPPGQIGFTPR